MKGNDTEKFAELMDLIGEIYGEKVTQKRKAAFFMVLQDMPFGDVKNNVTIMLRSRKFTSFPVPADIRNPLSDDDRKIETEQAWLQVIEKIRDVGHWKSVTFDDPCIMKAIEAMGGWERVAMVDTKDTKWLRMEFEKVYASVSPVDAPLSLPGAFETINEEKTAARTKALADERAKALPCPSSVKQELARRREESE